MPSKGKSLTELAYYSLSKKDFLNLSRTKTHSIEKAVFDDIQEELRKNHKPSTPFIEIAKIPVYFLKTSCELVLITHLLPISL
jgi:hypothetical protein